MKLPLLSISDPTLALNEELPLSWYAGFQGLEDLPQKIALLLDNLSVNLNVRFVVFGGSGGGFAAISIAKLMTSPVSILVWNPQTAIDDYVPNFVNQYLEVAFPSLKKNENNIKKCLNETGIRYSIRDQMEFSEAKRLLYLQNKSDWHYQKHAVKFFECIHFGNEDFEGQWSKGVYFLLGDFGVGHVAPSKNIIVTSLKFLIDEIDESIFLSVIKNQRRGIADDVVNQEMRFSVSTILCSGKIISNITLDNCDEQSDCLFAFYLLRDGKKFLVREYEKSNTATFDISTEDRNLEVIGYVFKKGMRWLKRVKVCIQEEIYPNLL